MINPVASDVMLVGETDYREIEFSGDDIAGGVTITGAAVAVAPGVGLGTGLVLASATAIVTPDGSTCYAWMTAALPGEYDVTFTVSFSDGKVLNRVYHITVF